MTLIKKPLYYCHECKTPVGNSDSLFFIDDQLTKSYCSEECIEDYHLPLVKHFEKEMKSLKEFHQETAAGSVAIEPQLVNEILLSPDEIYRFSNELGESYHHFIKKIKQEWVVIIASVFKGEPSFIFGAWSSSSVSLINEFRQGSSIVVTEWKKKQKSSKAISAIPEAEEKIEDDEDSVFLQLLESKKSQLLAHVLMIRKDQDIAIEDFGDYESCFQETLEHPDEVFEYKDKEGDVFFNYIKNYNSGENFFYIVSCLKRKSSDGETMVYPVLGLPTNDMAIVQEFCIGKQISGPLKN
jgi:hypothetical protein